MSEERKEEKKKIGEEILKRLEKLEQRFENYIECPGCGDYILKENKVCRRCLLEWNGKKWVKIKEKVEDEEEDWF
jgi:ribosomal protein L37AE/L43A